MHAPFGAAFAADLAAVGVVDQARAVVLALAGLHDAGVAGQDHRVGADAVIDGVGVAVHHRAVVQFLLHLGRAAGQHGAVDGVVRVEVAGGGVAVGDETALGHVHGDRIGHLVALAAAELLRVDADRLVGIALQRERRRHGGKAGREQRQLSDPAHACGA
uniref:Uncharacterized protein n=1 Tax=Mizugakiibacter sediminis TaxID=1475481 RepID=A0A0S6YZK5_9GAMM